MHANERAHKHAKKALSKPSHAIGRGDRGRQKHVRDTESFYGIIVVVFADAGSQLCFNGTDCWLSYDWRLTVY